jgi:uncharacterized membrane protein
MQYRFSWQSKIQYILTAIIGLALVLRCWNIKQSFWWDEIWSTMTYAKADSLWMALSSLGYYFNNHILYSLLAHSSITLLGESEFSARLPALVMGLLSIVVAFQFVRKHLGEYCALICAFLLAISAFHIDHSTEARGYSGLALFALLSSLYFLKGLRINTIKEWSLYVVFSVLGCYIQIFMIAVCIAQLFFFLVVLLGEKSGFLTLGTAPKPYKNFFIALFSAAIVTLLVYAPVLPAFLANMGKVRLVSVSRIPFLMNLLNAMLPGLQTLAGSIVYGVTGCWGLYAILKKDNMLGIYILTIISLPLLLYVSLNPMFMFERYFIFALPFVLLVVSSGIVVLSQYIPERYQTGFVFLCLLLVCYIQIPSVKTVLTQDRQNYREAVQYVEVSGISKSSDLVFSIGYAGENFKYYAQGTPVVMPETLRELLEMAAGKKRIWCLITAWLPALHPPHEDQALYAEKAGQNEIYAYVKKRFHLKKQYNSKYPVEIYYLEN